MEMNWSSSSNVLVHITPLIAAEWLKRNLTNRDVKPSKLKEYVRDMLAGAWRLTHQGIAFDRTGSLVDGQHRLLAICEAGVGVTMYVATGLDPQDRALVDIGAKRSPNDALVLSGRRTGFGSVGPNTEAGMWSRMMHGIKNVKGHETRAELLAFFQRHQTAGEWAISEFGQHPRSCGHLSPVMAAVARAYYHVDRARLAAFVRVLSTGFPECPGQEDSAAIHFRNALINGRMQGRNSNLSNDTYGKASRAIAYFMQRRPLNKFYAPIDEPYPLPDDNRQATGIPISRTRNESLALGLHVS